MTINLSFVRSPLRWVPPLTAAIVVMIVVLLLVGIGAVIEGSVTRNELPTLRMRVAKMQAELAGLPNESADDLPSTEKLGALRQRVVLVNRLTGGAGQPLLGLLAGIEKLLPDHARLVSLHHLQDTGVTTLVAESDSSEILTQFLQRLEQSQQFAEVLLVRQAQRTQRGGLARQFELRLRGRS